MRRRPGRISVVPRRSWRRCAARQMPVSSRANREAETSRSMPWRPAPPRPSCSQWPRRRQGQSQPFVETWIRLHSWCFPVVCRPWSAVIDHLVPASCDAFRPSSSRARKSSSESAIAAAATFCARCVTFDVPGIGSMFWLRFKSQASASCPGVAWYRRARLSSKAPGLARSPAASGNQGIKPIPREEQ